VGEVCRGNEKCVLKFDQEQFYFHYLKAEERKEKMGRVGGITKVIAWYLRFMYGSYAEHEQYSLAWFFEEIFH
jgi:hypothetical protein